MPELSGSFDKGFDIKESVSDLVFDKEGLVIDQTVYVDGVTHRVAKYDDNGCVAIRFDTKTGANFKFNTYEVRTQITNNKDADNTVTVSFSKRKN